LRRRPLHSEKFTRILSLITQPFGADELGLKP
jgi:hypothetical protein